MIKVRKVLYKDNIYIVQKVGIDVDSHGAREKGFYWVRTEVPNTKFLGEFQGTHNALELTRELLEAEINYTKDWLDKNLEDKTPSLLVRLEELGFEDFKPQSI